MTSHVRSLAAAVALVVLPATALAQQRGTITGRVIDSASQQPVPSAQVRLVGTTIGTLTGADGRYRLDNVPAGRASLRAQRIGYAARTVSVTVTTGQEVTADIALEATAAQIDEVVVTASGESQRTRETGASIGKIQVDSIPMAPIHNFSDVLTSREPGVTVQPAGGTAGTGSRIRIRGSNSISLSNDPLIIVDGVRMNNDANSTTIGVGGQRPSRFEDIEPEDIADIQVIKGPAAAALYGTAAANGVLVITTKRGEPGKTRWSAHAEYGPEKNYVTFPTNYAQFGTVIATGNITGNCNIISQGRNTCTPDSLVSFNPLEVHSPFITGYREGYGLSAAGGGQQTTYYVSGDYYREQGVYDPNVVRRYNLRANLHANLSDKFDLGITTNYLQNHIALPQNDNNLEGVVSGGLLGSAQDDELQGYFFATPAQLFQLQTNQDIDRFAGGVNMHYRPLAWLAATFQAGVDYTTRYDQFLVQPGVFSPDQDPDAFIGVRQSNPYQIWDYTANGAVTGSFQLRPGLTSKTTVGIQYERQYQHGTEARGEGLVQGTGSLNGTTQLFTVDELNQDVVTIGGLAQEELSWRDRVFLSGAVRTDRNSAFGVNEHWVLYPAVNASWVIGEEPFFPKTNLLSSLRVRAAYGQSGQRPNFRQAVTFFSPLAVATNTGDEVGITPGGTGNPNLKPEKTSEYEFGFDAAVWKEKANVSFTYYHKVTHDALVNRTLPPSLGAAPNQFINLGSVLNRGFELLVNTTPVNMRNFRFDLTLSGSTTKNRVLDLGEGIEPIIFGLGGDTQRHQNGYPLGGYWAPPLLSYSDANGDGIIEPDEITVGDTAVFLGSPFPTRELSITPRLTVFKYVRVSALFDYRGGFKLDNATESFRCGTIRNCNAIQNRNAPLADQAAAVANAVFGTEAPYIETANFWKLRDVSVTLSAPEAWTRRSGLSGLSLTLSGANLATWTKYRGLDPELNTSAQANFNQADFLTQPPVRYYTARIDINW
ncbi:MAG: SusC/RagA family TonB-linked outer membrane protein [Gemmatimonadaceae bacterium]|nr:SusC/RagA family TonB-linked outer membrane protein [Gemmatimonadaceae bacterium]